MQTTDSYFYLPLESQLNSCKTRRDGLRGDRRSLHWKDVCENQQPQRIKSDLLLFLERKRYPHTLTSTNIKGTQKSVSNKLIGTDF